MLEEVTPKLLAMPSDDELYATFFEAATEWAHDNIKPIVKMIWGFLDAAKWEVKKLVVFDAAKGISIRLDMQTWNDLLKGFLESQPFAKRAILKPIMAANTALTFDDFVARMKKTQDNIDVCNSTLSRILILFAQWLARKYVVTETEEHIRGMIHAIFG